MELNDESADANTDGSGDDAGIGSWIDDGGEYPLMTVRQIKALPVQKLGCADCNGSYCGDKYEPCGCDCHDEL